MAAEIEKAVSSGLTQPHINKEVEEVVKLTLEEKLENAKAQITDKVNDYLNYGRAESFTIQCIAKSDVDENQARSFIKYVIPNAYHFEGTTGSKMVTDLLKAFKDNRKRYLRDKELAANNNSLEISSEFKGLYTKEINAKGEIEVKPYYEEIAKRVIDNLHVISYKENLYVYVNGRYENNTRLVESEAVRYLNGILRLENGKKITNNLKDVMTNIRTYNPVPDYPFPGVRNAINVLNGVIIFDDEGNYKLVEHDPDEYQFNYILPVTFDPNASSEWIKKQIEKYSDRHRAIIQVLAQVFVQSMGYSSSKLAYFLYGPTDCGKSTVLELFREFVGKSLTCGIALNRMSTEASNKFALAPLEGKLINIKDEMAYFNLQESATLKDVTGSYKIDVEPKGVDPYTAISTAVHVFASNDAPTFDGRIRNDSAFWSRFVLIPCTKTKFQKDDTFHKRLTAPDNMSGLLNEVLKVVSLHIQGAPWEFRYDQGDEWEEVRDEWMKAGNPLYNFVTENMVRGGETSILKEELLMIVQQWCDTTGLYKKVRPETVKDLNSMVKMCGGEVDDRKCFYIHSETEKIERRADGKHKLSLNEQMITDRLYCFSLPWTWKADSPYKLVFRAAKVR